MDTQTSLGIVVVGASGDLAQRKVIPALFSLFCQDYFPPNYHIYGMARSAFDQESFRKKVAENLTCRYTPGESCADRMEAFLSRCHYCQGHYSSTDSFLDLYQLMHQIEGSGAAHRIFYMAIPPSVFMDVSKALGDSGLIGCGDGQEWSRIVVEKPFGRDRSTSDELVEGMQKVFTEEMTYRIDHYLGKEIVQDLMVLRFANQVFEPLWNRDYIESVRIRLFEPIGVGQRGGYFDGFGIIRDVMQNHLLQILALLAMEKPAKFMAGTIRDAKVKLLQSVVPVTLDDLVVGQYTRSANGKQPAYTQEPTVPSDSLTPTYAAAVLKVDNPRWAGVPFFLEAGKALDQRINEVRIRFREVPALPFGDKGKTIQANELVIRIQPDEAITLRIMNKAPGLGMNLIPTDLNLRYQSAFNTTIPDAYECLLLDVLHGDRNLFIRSDELAAAWDIFTPVLGDLETRRIVPSPYPFGSGGPEAARKLARRHGIVELEGSA